MLKSHGHHLVKLEIGNKSCVGLGASLSILVILGTGKDRVVAKEHNFIPTKAFLIGMCVRERS